MKLKGKILIVGSVLAIAAAGGVAIGTTTALFNDTASTSVHINAGRLNVNFYVSKIVCDKLNASGTVDKDQEVDLKTTYGEDYYVEGKGIDLKKFAGSAFSISECFPTMKGTVTFLVENGSTIAVNVACEQVVKGYFVDGQVETEMTEAELAVYGVSTSWTDDRQVNSNDSTTFTTSFAIDKDAGNEYQNSYVTIDPTITATQVTR